MAKRRKLQATRTELIKKSREAALNAVQTYNNPLTQFKSESFIVLMIIAWTYLLHAYYRQHRIDIRYFDHEPGTKRRFRRTRYGEIIHWSLEDCIKHSRCPLDPHTVNNLRLLLPLRHKVEHQMCKGLDNYLSAKYQACALNYCHYVVKLFGSKYAMSPLLAYSIQFSELTRQQVQGISPDEDDVPDHLKSYIAEFDSSLSDEEYADSRYSYRLWFTKRLVNHRNQADSVIEFVSPDSELAKAIEREFWVTKEVERQKYIPSQIVALMRNEGYPLFNMHHHTYLWKELDGRNPSKGYGVQVASTWYWYERWVDVVRQHCADNTSLYT